MAIGKLKCYKSPGIDLIPKELVNLDSRTIRYEIHKLINCFRNKDELPEKRKWSIILLIY